MSDDALYRLVVSLEIVLMLLLLFFCVRVVVSP